MDIDGLLRTPQFARVRAQGAKAVQSFLEGYYQQAVDAGDERAKYEISYHLFAYLRVFRKKDAALAVAHRLAMSEPTECQMPLLFAQALLEMGEPSLAGGVIQQALKLLPDPLSASIQYGRLIRSKRVEFLSKSALQSEIRQSCIDLEFLAINVRIYEGGLVSALLPLEGDVILLEAKKNLLERIWCELMAADRFHGGEHGELIRRIEQEVDTLSGRIAEVEDPD